MTNVVIFGKNPYLVDIVGHWLGGHEPGNFGLFHIAMERGKLDVMNPMHIPVYEWQDGVAVRRPLTSFTRTPLRSFYLQQRGKEPLWHLCNEPFDYAKVSEKKLSIPAKPTTRVLNQHYPNANNPQLAIEFSVPERGWALVEILDQSGNNLEVISNAICEAGYHMAAWNTAKYASGSYQVPPALQRLQRGARPYAEQSINDRRQRGGHTIRPRGGNRPATARAG